MTPTRYPGVNEALDLLRSGAESVLDAELLGIYISGSLAAGDFDPESSDIDFVVAVWNSLETNMVRRLRHMHADLAMSHPWGARMEGAYIDRGALRRHVAGERHPFINDDHPLGLAVLDETWVLNRAQLREHGLTLYGPEPASLIDPVSSEQLKAAMRKELNTWWRPMLRRSSKLQPRRYQAFAIFTMCRALYLFEHGRIASKPEAARWAISSLDSKWRPVINRASVWRADPTVDRAALAQTNAFIQLVLDKSEPKEKGAISPRTLGRTSP